MDFEKYFKDATNKDELISELKSDIGKEFVLRSDFNMKNDELKRANELISDHAKQLKSLTQVEGDKTALKKEIEQLRELNKEAETKYADELKNLKIDTAMTAKLNGLFQPDTIDYIKTLIKKEHLTFTEDGSVVGLDEQIVPIKESKKSFLIETNKNPVFVKGGGTAVQPGITRAEIEAIKDPVARQRKIAENLNLFK